MKSTYRIFGFALLMGMIFAASALAGPINITIYDQKSNGTSWHGMLEDQEVEPGMYGNQAWDLEGFFLNGNVLTMIGGFDFKDGSNEGSSTTWHPGDIFIALENKPKFGMPDADGTGTGRAEIPNTFGYNFVYHFDALPGSMAFHLYEINANTTLKASYFEDNDTSNPWIYVRGGTEIGSGAAALSEYATDALLASAGYTGIIGGTHYSLSVNLPSNIAGSEFYIHYTMECGNDNLMGHQVPEPGTFLLLGLGLTGLAGFARYTRRK